MTNQEFSSAMRRITVYQQPNAPAKPALGAPCNGCGLCCLWQPCPLGMLLSGSRQGPCRALVWDESARRYHCSAAAHRLWGALARRWIAAGAGCDADFLVDSTDSASH